VYITIIVEVSMKSRLLLLSLASVFVAFSLFACTSSGNNPDPGPGPGPGGCNSPVSCYGELKASGNKIVGSKTGETPVQVRGVSFGWSNTGWGSDKFFAEGNAENTVNAMVDGWKAEVIRVPMGTSNEEGVVRVINAALARGVYVIIDWHSHNAHNEVAKASEFFARMASAYGQHDNVIFEIYNEPVCNDGGTSCAAALRTTWAQIKTYAEQIIPVIRQHSDNLILVGTPFYCQEPNRIIETGSPGPLADGNVAYVLHFYSKSHLIGTFSGRINNVLNAGLPLFISEYGTTHSDGGQGTNLDSHDAGSTDRWMEFLNDNQISSAAWNVNNKREGASFFDPYYLTATSPAEDFSNPEYMTASGKYIYNMLLQWAAQSPWRQQ
jgi:endoglucanase